MKYRLRSKKNWTEKVVNLSKLGQGNSDNKEFWICVASTEVVLGAEGY
jgi:hypothetical protein